MFIANNTGDYKIIDCGEGEKLECWGKYILIRPDPQVIWKKQHPEKWINAHAHYIRSDTGGGHWVFNKKLPEKWILKIDDLSFYVRPTGFKHTGLFPEQSANWSFIREKIKSSPAPVSVLNLFAYTGGATLACAKGGANVVHLDAAKSMVSWAKENSDVSGLSDKPIRYITDDCMKFVLREIRRGNKYDAIIMDPPSYGRGANGQVWKVEKDLFDLVFECSKLLSDDPLFFIINSYTTGLSCVVTGNMLNQTVAPKFGGKVYSDDLAIPIENSRLLLPCGTTSRWCKC